MAADYLISSLQPLDLDGAAPYAPAHFLAMCRDQLSTVQADAAAAVLDGNPAPTDWSVAARWRDLEDQLRNAIAAERARARGQDPARWRRPVAGCSLDWANRVAAAFRRFVTSAPASRTAASALTASASNAAIIFSIRDLTL